MILETIVTTLDAAGRPNAAPMGITLDGGAVVLRPYRTTITCRNLETRGEGVVNVTDNVLLMARAALLAEMPAHRPAARVKGVILEDAAHWKEFVVETADLAGERAMFRARVVAEGRARDLFVFNRGQHAVVEATILATRLHLLDPEVVRAEIDRLRPLVDKTGGPREREAFAVVEAHLRGVAATGGVR